jgi:hypothetical protein
MSPLAIEPVTGLAPTKGARLLSGPRCVSSAERDPRRRRLDYQPGQTDANAKRQRQDGGKRLRR